MNGNELWVFGYGSLMWRPNFPHVEEIPALLRGYHRALCIYSTRYRGTPERPGLVLGLDRGGSCWGRAFRVAAMDADEVVDYLHRREMVNRVYLPRFLPVALADGRRVTAYCFVADRGHDHYTGKLEPEQAADMVLMGRGHRGTALEYLENTVRHLDELGIKEGPLHHILALATEKAGKG